MPREQAQAPTKDAATCLVAAGFVALGSVLGHLELGAPKRWLAPPLVLLSAYR